MNIIMIDKNEDLCSEITRYFKNCSEMEIIKNFRTIEDTINNLDINLEALNLAILSLDNMNLNIDLLIEHLPNECAIIGLASDTDILHYYINIPQFQRLFLKPISYSTLFNYIAIQNHINFINNSKKLVLHSLSEIGFNINHTGTIFLAEACYIAMKNKIRKLSDIYTLLAYNHNTDPKHIGWSITNAINKAAEHQDYQTLKSFFKIYDHQRLTAKYIISYFINYNNKL